MIQDMINSETIWIQLNRQTQTYSRLESSYYHYLDMLKLQTNERNDAYIFSRVVTCDSLPASLQSFKRKL